MGPLLEEPPVTTNGEPAALQRDPGQPSPGANSVLARGTAWNTLGQFGPLAANLALTPYVIHGLGRDRYGLFMLVSSIAAFLGTFYGGIGLSAQRYFTIYAGRDDKVATTRLLFTLIGFISAFGSVLFLLIFFSAPYLLEAFGISPQLRAEGEVLLRTIAVIVMFSLIRALFNCVLYARARFGFTNVVGLVLYLAYAVAAVISVKYGYGLRGIAVGLAVQSLLSAVLLVPQSFRYLSREGLVLLPWSELRAFLGYASKVQGVTLSRLINSTADNIVAGAFLRPVAKVGMLAAGSSFAEQLRMVPNNAQLPILTVLGHAVGEHGERPAVAEFRRVQKLWVTACTGWSVTAMGAAFFGLRHWLGGPYAVSGTVAAILVAGNMFSLWAAVTALWAGLVGKPEIEARYAVSSVAVNGLLTLVLVVPFGIVGIVCATAVGQVFGAFYLLRLCRRRLEVSIPSFFGDVPWLPAVVCGVGNFALEAILSPWLPGGAVGLLSCAVAAAPAFAAYFVLTLGPRRVAGILTARLPARLRRATA
jgi:O-antigen/teichoic acid export membrane protein